MRLRILIAVLFASVAIAGCASTTSTSTSAPTASQASPPPQVPTDTTPTDTTPTDTTPTDTRGAGCGQDNNDSPPCDPYNPPDNFCDSHDCIPNYANGSGYVVQCNDGTWSHSGGRRGACSDHGGESSGSPSASSAGTPAGYTQCDQHIAAAAATTDCPFAENTFYEYWAHQGDSSFSVYSPNTGTSFSVHCSSNGGQVDCSTDQGGDVQFSQSSVDSYTSSQAASYAATHQLAP